MKVVFLVVGLVLLLIGAIAAATGYFMSAGATAAYNACVFTSPPAGFCDLLLTPRAAYDAIMYAGIAIVVVGVILAAVGAALPEAPRPGTLGASVPATGPWPQPAPATQTAPCPVCGQPLAWVAQYNRWYCGRCGQYR